MTHKIEIDKSVEIEGSMDLEDLDLEDSMDCLEIEVKSIQGRIMQKVVNPPTKKSKDGIDEEIAEQWKRVKQQMAKANGDIYTISYGTDDPNNDKDKINGRVGLATERRQSGLSDFLGKLFSTRNKELTSVIIERPGGPTHT